MRTRILSAFVLMLFAILAVSTLSAQQKSGQYEPGTGGKISRKLPQVAATDSSYDFGPYLTYRPVLAPGDGRKEVDVYCNTCHSPIYITMQPPLSADAWAAEVTKMQKAFGADIPDEVTKKIVRYLQSNYTPETRKH